jgi:hypothetical protein
LFTKTLSVADKQFGINHGISHKDPPACFKRVTEKNITLIECFKFKKGIILSFIFGGFESCLDLHKKTRKSIGVGTNKKAPKAEKHIIYFSALGTFANFRRLVF